MESFENNNLVVIPVSYNLFLNDLRYGNQTPRFEHDNMLEKSFIISLVEYVNSFDDTYYIAIDMNYISSYARRGFVEFSNLLKHNNVFFYNINTDTDIKVRMLEDMQKFLNFNDISNMESFQCFYSKPDYLCKLRTECKSAIDNRILHIIKSVIEEKEQFLESSGIWSNMYVDLKKLFLNNKDYTFIVYKMAEVAQQFPKIDSLISTSKTGAILANLVGQMINKKVIYIVGIGPKFSLSFEEINNEIRNNRNYLYICDFICLGTELKILNALIKSRKADLIGGICVASYINLMDEKYTDNILGKTKCLINVCDHGIDYKITVTKQEKRCGEFDEYSK